jgi:hypothetical protein
MSTGTLFVHTMTAMFITGLVGCLLVIPITAYRLFSVLFEKDDPNDNEVVLRE